MRASDLRINEKRGLLKRLGQTAKSLFSNDAMKDRAVAIVADQWESDWRQFIKNKATEKKDGGAPKYPAQDEKTKKWIIYPELFAEFIIRKGVNAQVAKRIVNQVAPELSKGNKELKPKDDIFFNEITRSLIDADALEIKDPKGLIKRVKGDAEVGGETGAQLKPTELANEFFDSFVTWAKEAGYTMPTTSTISEDLDLGKTTITKDLIKRWIKEEHLPENSENIITKFNTLIGKSKITTEDELRDLFTKIYFGTIRLYLYDVKNKKPRTADAFQEIVDVAIQYYTANNDTQMVSALKDALEKSPEEAFKIYKKRLQNDSLIIIDNKGGIEGTEKFEKYMKKDLLTSKVKEEVIGILMKGGWIKYPPGPEGQTNLAADPDATKTAVDNLEEKDLEGIDSTNPNEIAQAVIKKRMSQSQKA